MPYIVAFKQGIGSVAYNMELGEKLNNLSNYLTLNNKNISIMIINNLKSFMEYAPFYILDKEEEFIYQVLKL